MADLFIKSTRYILGYGRACQRGVDTRAKGCLSSEIFNASYRVSLLFPFFLLHPSQCPVKVRNLLLNLRRVEQRFLFLTPRRKYVSCFATTAFRMWNVYIWHDCIRSKIKIKSITHRQKIVRIATAVSLASPKLAQRNWANKPPALRVAMCRTDNISYAPKSNTGNEKIQSNCDGGKI